MGDNREKEVVEKTRRSTSSIHDLTGAAGGSKKTASSSYREGEVNSLGKAIFIIACAVLGVGIVAWLLNLLFGR